MCVPPLAAAYIVLIFFEKTWALRAGMWGALIFSFVCLAQSFKLIKLAKSRYPFRIRKKGLRDIDFVSIATAILPPKSKSDVRGELIEECRELRRKRASRRARVIVIVCRVWHEAWPLWGRIISKSAFFAAGYLWKKFIA